MRPFGIITNEVTETVGRPFGIITNEVTETLGAVDPPASSPYWKWMVALTGVAGAVGLAYHGYRRTNSTAAAIGWGILGAVFPVNLVAAGVAAGQGFAKKKSGRKAKS
jgi:hypothetical protein